MTKNVLIVDDDSILRRLIANKFEKQGLSFKTLLAANGNEAVAILKAHPVSLVVTDLQMPQMDGFSLLAHLSAAYPDIPAIILTAYGTADAKKKVLAGGAIGYMEKPFVIEALAMEIQKALERESEGGTLQTVPLETFVQLIEMEQKTCTLRVTDKRSGTQGVLFFRNGDLMDARIGEQNGTPAAHAVFGWEKVNLAIQDDCALKEKRIQDDLQAILFEAMRLRDEAMADGPEAFNEDGQDPAADSPAGQQAEAPVETSSPQGPETQAERLSRELAALARGRPGIEDVYPDHRFDPLMRAVDALGRQLGAGSLRACYLAEDSSRHYVLLPEEITTVVAVRPDCPRDIIVRVLYG